MKFIQLLTFHRRRIYYDKVIYLWQIFNLLNCVVNTGIRTLLVLTLSTISYFAILKTKSASQLNPLLSILPQSTQRGDLHGARQFSGFQRLRENDSSFCNIVTCHAYLVPRTLRRSLQAGNIREKWRVQERERFGAQKTIRALGSRSHADRVWRETVHKANPVFFLFEVMVNYQVIV